MKLRRHYMPALLCIATATALFPASGLINASSTTEADVMEMIEEVANQRERVRSFQSEVAAARDTVLTLLEESEDETNEEGASYCTHDGQRYPDGARKDFAARDDNTVGTGLYDLRECDDGEWVLVLPEESDGEEVLTNDPTGESARDDVLAAMHGFLDGVYTTRYQYQETLDAFFETQRAAAENTRADVVSHVREMREEMESMRAERFSAACSRFTSALETPAGYGSAVDVAGDSGAMLLDVLCDEESGDFTVEVGDVAAETYVYPTGYQWDAETESWEPIELQSLYDEYVGDWIVGEAFADIAVGVEDMGTPQFVAAYTCQLVDDEWKCGCTDAACLDRGWQLQGTVPSTENQEISRFVSRSSAEFSDYSVTR